MNAWIAACGVLPGKGNHHGEIGYLDVPGVVVERTTLPRLDEFCGAHPQHTARPLVQQLPTLFRRQFADMLVRAVARFGHRGTPICFIVARARGACHSPQGVILAMLLSRYSSWSETWLVFSRACACWT